MILDNATFQKVGNLLRLPNNCVEYHGAHGTTVDFFVGIKNIDGDYISGCFVRVTEDFKIDSVRRISLSEGRFTRNWPVRRRVLPLLVPGILGTTYKGILYSPEQISAMRDWAKDCQWGEDQSSDFIDELTDTQILKGVQQHYSGGLAQFVIDCVPVFCGQASEQTTTL